VCGLSLSVEGPRARSPTVASLRGGTGARRRRRRQYAMQPTANQRSNLWWKDLSMRPIDRFGTVNRSHSNNRGIQRPYQVRSGPHCNLVVSRGFSSFHVASRAFRFESASKAGPSPRQSCKAGPIQAEWVQRPAPRHQCGGRRATFELFRVTIGPTRPWFGNRGAPSLINSLTV